MTATNPGSSELLFSYGTLRDPAVQQSTFGRLLDGDEDQLEGYSLTMLEVTDPAVVARSGVARHPIMVMTGQPEDHVEGTVFRVTQEELRQADEYEVADYRRDRVKLASGRIAWAYIDARPASYEPDGSNLP